MKHAAIRAPGFDIAARGVETGVVEARHERRQVFLESRLAEIGKNRADVRADQRSALATEVARAYFVAGADDAVFADGHEGIGDAVEDGFERSLGLRLEGLRNRRFHLVVVRVDELQQRNKIGSRNARLFRCGPDFFP